LHVLDGRRFERRVAVEETADDVGGEVVGSDEGELPADPAHRGPAAVDDEDVCHAALEGSDLLPPYPRLRFAPAAVPSPMLCMGDLSWLPAPASASLRRRYLPWPALGWWTDPG